MCDCGIKIGKWALGIFLLILVVIIWVSSSEAIQFIFESQDYRHPFFLTYFNTTLFMLYLFGFAIFPEWRGSKPWKTEYKHPGTDEKSTEEQMQDVLIVEEKHWTWIETAKVSLGFCPIWFIANYAFNSSLELTSVASSSIISTTSSFFTLILGAILKIEEFSVGKLLSIFICIGGVALVSIVDQGSTGSNPLFGDILCVGSAICYSVYTIFLRKHIPNEKLVSIPMLFGFVGLFNFVLLWPLIFLLHYTGFEVFEIPPNLVIASLTANGLIGTVLSDIIWSLAVLYTSPVVGTMGLSLTIPLAMIVDVFVNHKSFDMLYLIGSGLVVLGFILVNITSRDREIMLWRKFKSLICCD
eukprot:TRINITY_DN5375_c0_g1_i1.p1 TRINITY_DN5375_c0_g1~~TRINITY_DN5375_c0_g1_i1.p1  ORF type:complete len:356 (+),score=7.53 TRINITY_DN5375_c0_g1_i1:41-1108(+)